MSYSLARSPLTNCRWKSAAPLRPTSNMLAPDHQPIPKVLGLTFTYSQTIFYEDNTALARRFVHISLMSGRKFWSEPYSWVSPLILTDVGFPPQMS